MGKHPADLKFLPNRWHGESKLQFWPGVPQLSAFLHLSQRLSSQSLFSASHGRGICLWTSSVTWPHPWLSSSTGCMSFHHDKLGQILVQFEKNSQPLFRYVKEGPSTYLAKFSFFRPQMSDSQWKMWTQISVVRSAEAEVVALNLLRAVSLNRIKPFTLLEVEKKKHVYCLATSLPETRLCLRLFPDSSCSSPWWSRLWCLHSWCFLSLCLT